MRLLNHENLLSVKDIIDPGEFINFEKIYVVTELMETDLAQIIKSQQVLSEKHIIYFLFQIL